MTAIPIGSVRKLVASRGISSIGALLVTFSLDVWVYESTASYSLYAWIAVLAAIPPVLVSPVAGYFTDRYSKVLILMACEVFTSFLLGLMALVVVFKSLMVPGVMVAALLFAVVSEFRYTALTALLPEVAEKTELIALGGLQQAFRGFSILAGPLMGAVGYQYLGLVFTLMAAATSNLYALFVTSKFINLTVPVRRKNSISGRQFFQEYVDGLKWLNKQSWLKAIAFHFTLITASMSLFGLLTLPHVLDIKNASWLAIILSSQGLGLLFSGTVMMRVGKKIVPESMLLYGSFGVGITMFAFGMAENMYLMMAMAFGMGVQVSFVAAANQAIWQANTPDHCRGKMIAIRSMAIYMFTPLAMYFSILLSGGSGFETSSFQYFTAGRHWSGLLQSGLGIFVICMTIFFYCSALSRKTLSGREVFSESEENT